MPMAFRMYPFNGKSMMAAKIKMKLVKIISICILILMACLIVLKFVLPDFSFGLPFTYNKKITSSEILLKEINNIGTLSTIEYIYKSVFPFDFIEEDTDWWDIVRRRAFGGSLSETELEYLDLYDLCMSFNLDLIQNTYEFVVISTVVEAGIDLEDEFSELRFEIQEKNITMNVPDIVITEFTIEDADSSQYTYPDMDVNPQDWKKITAYVENKIRQKVIEDGILHKAEIRWKDFIISLLQESGWENISFYQ